MSLTLSLILPETFYQPGEAVLATVQAIFTAASDTQSPQSVSRARAPLSKPTSPTARSCAYVNHLTFSATGLERTDPSFIQNLHHPEHPVDVATAHLKKVTRPMFSTADALLMSDVELHEETPANFLVRFRLPASLPPTFKGSAMRFAYSLDLKAEYTLQTGGNSQHTTTTLTTTASTTLLVWPSAEAPLLCPPGRAPKARTSNTTTRATPRSLPANVAAFSAAAASRGSSLTGAHPFPTHTNPIPPSPHTRFTLGYSSLNTQSSIIPSWQAATNAPDIQYSGDVANGAVRTNGLSVGPFGSAPVQALTGMDDSTGLSASAGTASVSAPHTFLTELPPLFIPPLAHSFLDMSTSAAAGTSPGRGASLQRQSITNVGTITMLPLRTGSVQSVVSLAGATTSALQKPDTLFTQESVIASDLEIPPVIDYPLYSLQCKVRWQAVTEEQLASQLAPSTAPHTRYQGQHRDQHQQQNRHSYLHQRQGVDEDSCSLLGSGLDSESDEGDDSHSCRNASMYSGSNYRYGLHAMSSHKHINGGDPVALLGNAGDGAAPASTFRQRMEGMGGGHNLQPSSPGSVSGDGAGYQVPESKLAGLPPVSNNAVSALDRASDKSSDRHSKGSSSGPVTDGKGIARVAQTTVSAASALFRSVLSAPPTPRRTPSTAPIAGAAAVAGSGVIGGASWGALSNTGSRKAAVFGKPYMLSSGSHPLVRIVLQGPMEGPLQPGASFTGLLDFRTECVNPPAVRCHQVLIMLETEEVVAPECRQAIGRGRGGTASAAPVPSSATAVVIRKLHCEAQEMTSDLAVTHFAITVPPSGTPSFCTPMVALRWVVRFELTVGQAVNFASRPGPRLRLETISWAVPLLVLPPS